MMHAAGTSVEKRFGVMVNRLYEMDEDIHNDRWLIEAIRKGN